MGDENRQPKQEMKKVSIDECGQSDDQGNKPNLSDSEYFLSNPKWAGFWGFGVLGFWGDRKSVV